MFIYTGTVFNHNIVDAIIHNEKTTQTNSDIVKCFAELTLFFRVTTIEHIKHFLCTSLFRFHHSVQEDRLKQSCWN